METRSFPLIRDVTSIGRSGNNDVVISNKYASGRHCEISYSDAGFTIHDLNSTNGLFLNGNKIDTRILKDGDRILIGASLLLFISDEEAVQTDVLVSRLQNGDPNEREIAANVLGQLGEKSASHDLLKVLRSDTDTRVKAAVAEAIGLLGEARAVKSLLSFLDTPDIHLRNSVVRAIIRIADESHAGDVAHHLKHPEKRVRVLAAHILGQLRGANAGKALQKALQDDAYEVREAAVKALGEVGGAQSLAALLKAAAKPQEYPLVWVLDSLGKIREPSALPVLVDAVKHANAEVREAAANALGKILARESIPELIPLLEDPDERVRSSTLKSLGKLRTYVEIEKRISSLTGDGRSTAEIASIGDDESRGSSSSDSSLGEDRSAWQQWWESQAPQQN